MEKTAWYAPKGMYAWDFWLVEHGGEWHLFHLQAPRSLHPEVRHHHASVGHAVSSDLVHWQEQGTALEAGAPGEWDDRCLWTGSILPWQGRFYFLYTGRKRGEFLIQRIGLAVSEDLYRWEKHPSNPVLTADPRWYQTAPGTGFLAIEDWRDPSLCLINGTLTALITARTAFPAATSRWQITKSYLTELARTTVPISLGYAHGPLAGRGCIARATTEDFVRWVVHPPLFAPGVYGALECPQWLEHEGWNYLSFSTLKGWYTKEWAQRAGDSATGVHVWRSREMPGPWEPVNGNGVVLGTETRCYGTRFFKMTGREDWQVLSWRLRDEAGKGFCARIDTPRRMVIEDRRMSLAEPL